MKTLVYAAPEKVEVREMPVPEPKEDRSGSVYLTAGSADRISAYLQASIRVQRLPWYWGMNL